MTSLRHATATAVLMLGVALAPTPVAAQPASSAMGAIGRNHFDNANQYYSLHRYDDAAREFQQAYDITHRAELLFNLGRALEDGGHDAEALSAYERFDAAGAPGVDRATIQSRMGTLRARIAMHTVPPVGPTTGMVPAPAVVTAPASTVPTGTGTTGTTGATGQPLPAVPPSPSSPSSTSRALPIALVAGGGAALVTSLILGATVLAAHADVASNCPVTNHCPGSYRSEADAASTRGLIADIVGVAGIAAVTVGIVLLVTGHHTEPSPAAPQAMVGCTPSGCGGSLRVVF